MTEWQPIETAPKDRPILVYGNKEKGNQAEFGQRIAVAVYHSEMHYTYGDEPMFVYAPHRVESDGPDRCICPTHWMPLPEPPFGSIVHQGKKKGPTAWGFIFRFL